MKKIITIASILIIFTVLALVVLNHQSGGDTLYLLNWGEYINQDLVKDFENKFNCSVVEETVTSSETMYQKIVSSTTSYDVAIPGDYMVTKLKDEGYLKKIDLNNSKYESFYNKDNLFVDSLEALRNKYGFTNEYSLPYFWGAYSMIYNTKYSDTESVIKENGFKALFDRSLFNENVQIGMYSTARWTVAAYLMANGIDPNNEDFDQIKLVKDIKAAKFDVWGDDQLKRQTATGNLDLCFVQLGDFFDALYLSLEEGLDVNNSLATGLDALPFNVNVPSTTSAFFDAMVIPTTSKNYNLANEFINFMLTPENAYENALAIGYCPTLNSVVDLYDKDALNGELYFEDGDNPNRNITLDSFLKKYPVYLNPLQNADINKVTMFEAKDSSYMTLCETLVNQAKSNVSTGSSLGKTLCIAVVSVASVSLVSYIGYKYIKNYKKKKKLLQ